MGATVLSVGDKFLHPVTKKEAKWVQDYLGPNAFLKEKDQLFLFGSARQYLLDQTPKEYDFILWLDADDTLEGKENLRELVQMAEDQKVTSVFMQYLYQNEFNPDGSVRHTLIQHLRERLVKNDGTYKWIGEIHETLIDQGSDKKVVTDKALVIHRATFDNITDSIKRNIKNLEWEVYKTDAEDPRPIYYLAKAYFDLKEDKYCREALRLLKGYIAGSGWPEERAQAWEYCALIQQTFGDNKKAIQAAHNALIEDSLTPSYYITLAQLYMFDGKWEEALHWIKLSAQVPQRETTLIVNPKDLLAKSLEVIYQACINMVPAKLDEAWAAITKLRDIYPDEPTVIANWQIAQELRSERDLTMQAANIAQFLMNSGQKEQVKQLIASLPVSVATNPIMVSLLNQVIPPRVHDDNEISLFAGPGFETWSPKTIEEGGSGGSEEAIYRLSKELAKLGYKVSVYADPGPDAGDYDGVSYRPYYELNLADSFNIFISWRRPEAADMALKAKKHYLWLHDVPRLPDFKPERIEKFQKVIVLSKFHASLLSEREIEGVKMGVPPEKLFISRNGVSIDSKEGQLAPASA